ncbi:sensor histidine kinase [Halobaculum marinum]|uniref:histidine kinase n=1 Tax=Halobaculum marinum TaxID=3031996 RepID=A0ABD5X2X6_9EURY|nr:GAF domain-containing sensor histidine kinase [Halobaculum sp. DT55]
MNGAAGSDTSDPATIGDAGGDLARHADLQALVVDASTTLTSANPDELDAKLRWTLSSVATGLEAEHAAVYGDVAEVADGSDNEAPEADYELVSSWSRAGDSFVEKWVDEEAGVGPLISQVLDEGAVRLAQLSDDATHVPPGTERLRADGVESVLAVPVVRDWELWGVLSFAGCGSRERWTDHEVVLVRSLAELIANALARVERERRLAAQNERLEQFASVVSHDLRNPLNVVLGSVDLAEETSETAHFDRARRAAQRMDGIIDTVLGLARAGRDIGEVAPVSLDGLAWTAWDAVDTGAATLDVDAPGRVEADENRLFDALSNLFRNAVEHGGADVHVVVGARADGDGFYVADDGVGLPGDTDDLFARGCSGDAGGTGIGLTIVQQVVEAHGWRVDAGESSAGGARFDVLVDS